MCVCIFIAIFLELIHNLGLANLHNYRYEYNIYKKTTHTHTHEHTHKHSQRYTNTHNRRSQNALRHT